MCLVTTGYFNKHWDFI